MIGSGAREVKYKAKGLSQQGIQYSKFLSPTQGAGDYIYIKPKNMTIERINELARKWQISYSETSTKFGRTKRGEHNFLEVSIALRVTWMV